MHVVQAIRSRKSIRAYTKDPIDDAAVRELLDAARWSPSGSNMQPWKVIAVAGVERDEVVQLARKRLAANPSSEEGDHPVLPKNLQEPYRARRLQVSAERYALLGIPRENKAARHAIVAQNYEFWGAPVGLFFIIDKSMGHAQWAHLGMFMQSIALAAVDRGLSTCIQEAWALIRRSLHAHFALPENEMIYCGMALGHADSCALINSFRSRRIPVEQFASFRGF